MSSEVHEDLCFEVARAQLYAIVDKGTSDIESGRSRNAKTITEAINIFLHKSVMEGAYPSMCASLATIKKPKQQCAKHAAS